MWHSRVSLGSNCTPRPLLPLLSEESSLLLWQKLDSWSGLCLDALSYNCLAYESLTFFHARFQVSKFIIQYGYYSLFLKSLFIFSNTGCMWSLRLELREVGKQRSLLELKGDWQHISKLPILKRGPKKNLVWEEIKPGNGLGDLQSSFPT